MPGPQLQEQYSGPLLYLLLLPRKAEKLKVIAALSSHSIENGFVVYTKLCTVPGLISPSSATTLTGLVEQAPSLVAGPQNPISQNIFHFGERNQHDMTNTLFM